MQRDLTQRLDHSRRVWRYRRRLRIRSLDRYRFVEVWHLNRQLDARLVRPVAAVNVRSMLLEGDVASTLPRKTRHIPGQTELQSVYDSALAGSVPAADRIVLACNIDRQIPYPTEFMGLNFQDLDHDVAVPGSSGSSAALIAPSVRPPSSRSTGLSL